MSDNNNNGQGKNQWNEKTKKINRNNENHLLIIFIKSRVARVKSVRKRINRKA
jgi:hypothetical protein